MFRRWVVAVAALVVGGGTAAGLLAFANPDAQTAEVFVAARDIASGAPLTGDAIRLERMRLGATVALAFTSERQGALLQARAGHELRSGQLIQVPDLAAVGTGADIRLVFVPVRDVPPLQPGDRVDLLSVDGAGVKVTVKPFLLSVNVQSQTAGGLVVAVSSAQAAALLYASSALRLAAVVAAPGAAPSAATPISDLQAAEEAARR